MLRDPLVTNTRLAILLAEDDPDQSEMLKDILESEGFQVDTAFSGDVALRKLNTHSYALAILDIRMPGLNGSEVLRLFRKTEGSSRMPMVVVSAFATDAQIRQYKQDGADRSFSKPYDVEMLVAGIRELLAKQSPAADTTCNGAPPGNPNGASPWKQ